MKKFFMFLLVIFVWLLILGICSTGAILLGYPISVGFTLFASIFIIWYAVKFIVFIFRRVQAKRRVEKLVNIDKPTKNKQRLNFFQLFTKRDFDLHLKNVINTIAEKSPNASRDDIQELKWNLHLKFDNSHSDWLKQKDVSRPQISSPILSSHPYLKWLPFNQYLMLDVDSYLVNSNNGESHAQWFELLDSLSFCDKKIPLDAITISIHIDTLMESASQTAVADKLRLCIENVRERCAVNVPVSIVLIGLETQPGINAWLETCSESFLRSILGTANIGEVSPQVTVNTLFSQLSNIFHQGSITSLMNKGFTSESVSLSHLASTLENASQSFISRIFSSNNFQESPRLSGFYIVIKNTGNFSFNQCLLEGNVLCPYRGILLTNRTVADKIKLKRLGFYYTVASCLSLLIFSMYNVTSNSLEQIFYHYKVNKSEQVSATDITSNLRNRAVLTRELDEVNIAHWLLKGKDPLRTKFSSERFNKDLNDFLIKPIEDGFNQKFSDAENFNVDDKVDYINIVIRRINIYTAILNNSSIDQLKELPQPYDSAYITDVPELVLNRLNNLLIDEVDLGRRFNRTKFEITIMDEREEQRQKLISLISKSDGDMSWLVDWTNNNQNIKPVLLSDYWPITDVLANKGVRRAYTLAGRDVIEGFIAELIAAIGRDDVYINKNLPKFRQEYEKNYVAQWGAFLNYFNDGMDVIQARGDWLSIINNLPTSRNIYFTLMNEAWSQLEPFSTSPNLPDWHAFLIYYQDMLALGSDQLQGNPKKDKLLAKMAIKLVAAAGPVGKAIAGAGKSGMKTQKKLDKASGAGPGPSERELNLAVAAQELDAYKILIADLVFSIEAHKRSYENIKGLFVFPNMPESAGTSLAATQVSIKKLEALIGKIGLSTNPFWQLYMGPIKLLEAFMLAETACYLDIQWQNEFLYELSGIPDYKLNDFSYGEAGILWTFTDDHLSPFLKKRGGAGFNIKRVDGKRIKFENVFLDYINRAKDLGKNIKYESFNLDVKVLPTSVNKSALLFVSQTDLVLQCGEGKTTITNNNFIVQERIVWQPNCGAVTLKFTIGNRVIEKSYLGANGVKDFLKEFASGEHTFDIEEFPSEFYTLRQFEIQYIKVQFEIEGGSRLLQALDEAPPVPPKHITQCWV